MRTTLNTIYSRINTNLGKITTDMSKINDQISSGLQMAKLSDQPINLVNALRFRSTIVELDQYTNNIQNGNTIITSAESALTQMKDISLRAKTLAIQATDPSYSAGNREAIAVEVKNLFDQAVQLANTQVNGKYIFGGFRTTGYTKTEPAPFIVDKGDGYWVNGTTPTPLPALTSGVIKTGASDLLANDLIINGTDIGAVDLTAGALDTNGVNQTAAANLQAAINAKTGQGLYANSAALPTPGASGKSNTFSFELNGVPISVSTDGLEASGSAVSTKVAAAINAQSAATGVSAVVGDGSNGGPSGSLVFQNIPPTSTATITVANLSRDGLGEAELGFSDFSQKFVRASLTSQISGALPAGGGSGEAIAFTLNGVSVSYTSTAGGAAEVIAAIETVKEQTGVTALLGDGTNGGPNGAVVLRNRVNGDQTSISLAGLGSGPPDEAAITGLIDGGFAAPANNTGQVSLTSGDAFAITTSSANDITPPIDKDAILDNIGLGGGGMGNFDQMDDGQLVYGYPVSSGELKINGMEIPPPSDDTLSDLYANASAAAKATAINDMTAQTGVKAVISPAEAKATSAVTAGTLNPSDLLINGIVILGGGTPIKAEDSDNALLDAINAKTDQTGVKATRSQSGALQLAAIDGRNLHLQTSANGEAITHLTDGNRDQVSFGTLQLRSDRQFFLETVDPTVNSKEPGLAALGLAGGEAKTGETGDSDGDGKIEVTSIHDRTGTVRYTGDRINDLEIKIGKTNTMTVGANGQSGIMDTTIFTTLKALEDSLMGRNFTTVTGIHPASDPNALLNSKATGLEPDSLLPTEDLITADGGFTVSVTDHDYYPPRTTSMAIGVDPTVDSVASVTKRITGIPHLQASVGSDGRLTIASDDPARYTFALSDDTSNFLTATGVSAEFMQAEGIQQSLDNLDTLMENLTKQVSDFGARANRIDIQSQIYSTMVIATKENLSEVQDTDMVKAVMELKAKETAYQAALSAAAKTMQLSLVDYLK